MCNSTKKLPQNSPLSLNNFPSSENIEVHMEGRRWHGSATYDSSCSECYGNVLPMNWKARRVAEANKVCSAKCSVKWRSFDGETYSRVSGGRVSGPGLRGVPAALLIADVIHMQLHRKKNSHLCWAGWKKPLRQVVQSLMFCM